MKKSGKIGKMKITRHQLRRIIKEANGDDYDPAAEGEKAAVLDALQEEAYQNIEDILNNLWDEGVAQADIEAMVVRLLRETKGGFIGEPT